MSYVQTDILALTTQTAGTFAATASVAVSVGDVVVVGMEASAAATPTVQLFDNDGGTNFYADLADVQFGNNNTWVGLFWKRANSNYTPTWSGSWSGLQGGNIGMMAVKTSGWVGGPTVDGVITAAQKGGDSSSTVMSWTPSVTTQNNTALFVVARVNNPVTYTNPAGWSAESGLLFWNFVASSGSSTSASTGAFSGTSAWSNIFGAIYDSVVPLVGQALL